MKRSQIILGLLLTLTLSVNCIAQISGPTSTTLNNTYNYSYYSPTMLAGPSWFPSGGQVMSQWQGGSEYSGFYYYADIKWTSTGESTLMFANFSEQLSTTTVYVCSSGQAASVSLPATASICAGSTVQFTATPTNGGSSPTYVWKVNGVTKQSGSNKTYSTDQLVLNDVVSVTMTSSIICLSPRSATASTTVTNVTQPTPVSVIISDPGPMCAGTNTTFTASVTHGGSNPVYTWYRNGNVVDDNEISGNTNTYDPYNSLQNGENVKCYVTSNAACRSGSASVWSNTVTISIQSPTSPSVSINVQNQTMCEGEPVTFTASSPQNITSYSWSIGSSVQLSDLATFTPTGEFALRAPGETIHLTVGVSGSCLTQNWASDSHNQTVYAPSSIETLSVNSTEFCSSGTVNFTLGSPNVGTVSWKMRYQDGTAGWSEWGPFSPSPTNTYGVESGSGVKRSYEFQAFATSGTCDPAESNIVGITVYPQATLGNFDVNETEFCSSAQVGLTLSTFVGELTWRYRYKDGTSPMFGDWTVFSTEELSSLNTPTFSSGTAIQRVYEIEVQASSGTCGVTPWSKKTVTFYPAPSVGNFSVSPGTVFYGDISPALTLSHATSIGTVLYELLSNGSTWTQATSPLTVDQVTQFRAKATSGSCAPLYSDPVTVFLYPAPVITSEGGLSQLSGNTIKLSTGSYYSYQWVLDGVDIVGSTSQDHVADKPGLYTVRVKGSSLAPEASSLAFTILGPGPSQDENYISTVTFLKEGISEEASLFALRPQDYSQSTTYFDGLGRPMQTVTTMGSPGNNDVVQPIVYDEFGREFRKYLPFVPDEKTGRYKDNSTIINATTGDYMGIAANFYDQPMSKVADDDGDKPFAETVFENSPLNRVIKQGAPGSVWYPDGGRTIKMAYETNAMNEVLLWRFQYPTPDYPLGLVFPSQEGADDVPVFYAPGELFKQVTKDEQDHEVIEYTDKEGRTVLKRLQAKESPLSIGNEDYASTYYIYDDFGQLVCVISPEGSRRLASEFYASSSNIQTKEEFLRRWAFRYRYDERKRMVIKQVPGADSVLMVYDKRDRLVFTQDGKQRTLNQWSYTKYDQLNRPIITGIYSRGSALLRKDLCDLVYDSPLFEVYDGNAQTHGYSNNMFPEPVFSASGFEVLSVTYYDQYDFKVMISGAADNFDYKNDELGPDGGLKEQEPQAAQFVKGQVTGTKVKVLDSGPYLWTANYYDDKYRLIQATSSNLKNGFDRTTNVYDFVGKILQTKTRYVIPGHAQHPDTKISKRFSYDHAGRLLKTWHRIGDGEEVIISSNEYNELGQLVTKKLHQTGFDGTTITADPLADEPGTSYDTDLTSSSYSSSQNVYVASNSIRLLPGFTVPANSTFTARIGYSAEDALDYNNAIDGDFLQTIDYRYNIRGWLTKINEPSNAVGDDLFNMELAYNTPSPNGGVPQYNGNISEAIWKSAGLDKQSYGYDYDPMNRLLEGSYYNLAKPTANGRYDEMIGDPDDLAQFPAYDLNGNIQNLLRNGKTDAGAYGLMDKLHYDYGANDGNKLMFVSDAQPTGAEENGFKELVEEMTDYAYDENGNLTKDENKGIVGDAAAGIRGIKYNHLNLPERVTKSATEYIVYTYDATGRKLAQQVFGSEAKTTEYLGELVFEDNALQFVLHPEGRVVSDTEVGASDTWEYQYFLKDHLGNTRVVFSEKKNTTEYKATLEDDRQNTEMSEFLNYPNTRSSVNVFDHSDAGAVYTKSLLLHGGNNSQVGLAKSFEVNSGDVFDLEVYAKYEAPASTANNVDALLSQLVNAFSLGAGATPLDGAPAYSAFENLFQGGGPWINSSKWDPSAPKAYLNYILFDENFVLVDFGFDQISTDCEQESDLDPIATHDYLSLHVKVEQKGYLYVYLSNEQPTLTNVYFDDMKIVHSSAVEQVSDYYPFGLTFNSYQRENSVEQKYLYNGKELQNELDAGWLDYGARMYQPETGRWNGIDDALEMYPHESPYLYAANNPGNVIDIGGNFRITAEFARRYPMLARLIAGYLPLLKTNAVVKKAWQSITRNFDDEAFEEMVSFGSGPLITPTEPGKAGATTRVDAHHAEKNQFTPKYPDKIFLDASDLQTLEDELSKAKAGKQNDLGPEMFFISMKIMHEAAHYGYFHRFGNKAFYNKERTGEAGAEWERAAFKQFSYLDGDSPMKRDDVYRYYRQNYNESSMRGMTLHQERFYNIIMLTTPMQGSNGKGKKDADKESAKRSGGW